MMNIGIMMRPWILEMKDLGVKPRMLADDLLILSADKQVEDYIGIIDNPGAVQATASGRPVPMDPPDPELSPAAVSGRPVPQVNMPAANGRPDHTMTIQGGESATELGRCDCVKAPSSDSVAAEQFKRRRITRKTKLEFYSRVNLF